MASTMGFEPVHEVTVDFKSTTLTTRPYRSWWRFLGFGINMPPASLVKKNLIKSSTCRQHHAPEILVGAHVALQWVLRFATILFLTVKSP